MSMYKGHCFNGCPEPCEGCQGKEWSAVAEWLRGMENRHYPKDVFPDPEVPVTDAAAASVLRRFAPIWADQIERGAHYDQ